ncbi:FGGY-family carbohydrate kinase [Xenorhabdus sp. IM139775]|uniref:FGGY-family carbohydrate kinase n=1 Tax=Xenorhabdus sp. IM139775 TaxID=3025876 RepID=UPI002359F527|nr:FGGY-family carbohydrate kinase [Xenorhabdus sp. IM139775]MDC9593351.1 carbohydrate kinase [Xenorhabdus sp. IM139775]
MSKHNRSFCLGIDCGGTYLKAGLYDERGQEYSIERTPLRTITPQPGYAERDLNELWHTLIATVSHLLKNSGTQGQQIKGVGISAQGKGLFLLDKNNAPLGNGFLSSDRRATEIVSQWQQQGMLEKLYPHTRQTLWTGHPVSLLRWIKDNQPERYDRIDALMMAHDYLRWCLTGEKGCEESNISESNLYNMNTGAYDPTLSTLLNISEIDSVLPRIVGSTEICGEITPQAAELTGLVAGTPVVGGLFDVVSTALCAGLQDEYTLNAVMGTWSVTSGITDQLRTHEPHPYIYGRYANTGQYIVHEASPTSSGNLEWFSTLWGKMPFEEMNAAVNHLPKASSELFFLPFLYGSNAGLDMTAGFYGLQSSHHRGHLLQAVYEGVIFSHMTHLKRMLARFTKTQTIRVMGRPAHSKVWMQMFADTSNLPVELPQVKETGCLGAALAAFVGTGHYKDFTEAQQNLDYPLYTLEPDRDSHPAYLNKKIKYQLLIESLHNFHSQCKSRDTREERGI